MALSSSIDASAACSVADVVVDNWIRLARAHGSAPPATEAVRTDREFKVRDGVVLRGFSYSAALQTEPAEIPHFILLLQGSASAAAQLAETASRLALATRHVVFVFEYRGFGPGSNVRPTAASIQQDVDEILDALAEGGRRGVAIGLSLGGVFAIHSLKRAKGAHLRVLLDSVPAQLPWIPFLISCPRWMNPLEAATPDVAERLGVLYGADDGWARDRAAEALRERVRDGGGQAWLIGGGHVDLSPAGLAMRLPIYVDFVLGRKP